MGVLQSDGTNESGFALIVVLWAIGLLAVIAASIALATREHLVSVGSRANLALAEAAAEGALHMALFEVAQASAERRAPQGLKPPFACRFSGDALVQISLEPEAGKIDLNAAPATLLEAFFRGLGTDAAKAEQIANAVEDFRDIDKAARTSGGEDYAYRAAGLPYGPKNAGFDTPEELAQVIGIDRELYVAARRYLTVLSRRGAVDPSVMTPELRRILRAGGLSVEPLPLSSSGADQLGGAFTVRIIAALPDAGYVLRREARVLVETGTLTPHVLSWLRNPPLADGVQLDVPAAAPPC